MDEQGALGQTQTQKPAEGGNKDRWPGRNTKKYVQAARDF